MTFNTNNFNQNYSTGIKDPVGVYPAIVGFGCEWRRLLGMSAFTKRIRQSYKKLVA